MKNLFEDTCVKNYVAPNDVQFVSGPLLYARAGDNFQRETDRRTIGKYKFNVRKHEHT